MSICTAYVLIQCMSSLNFCFLCPHFSSLAGIAEGTNTWFLFADAYADGVWATRAHTANTGICENCE